MQPRGEYTMPTTVKEMSLDAIKKLPDDSTIDDIMETLYVQRKILIGQDEIDAGKGIPHDEAMKRLDKWLK